MDTRTAFEKLISMNGAHNILEISSAQMRNLRVSYRRNSITLDRMEEILFKAGWKKIPEVWKVKEL